MTNQPTIEPTPAEVDDRRPAAPFVFLLGFAAWVAAVICVVKMSDADDGIHVARLQTLAIGLFVVGAGLLIVAALYDIANRD